MQGPYLRKYGVETKCDFVLYETDGVDFKTDAVHASGDTTVMKDEGAEANTDNGFVDEGQGYSITVSATEMEAARIVVYIADQGTKAWLDTAIVIETYGNASAQHALDLDSATVTLADGGITATKIAADAITSSELATSAVDEIVDAVWNELSTGHVSAGKAGQQLWTDVDAILVDTGTDGVVLASGAITAAKIAAGAFTAEKFATDAIAAVKIAAGAANKIADHIIRRTFQNACDSSDGDAKSFRSLLGAIAKLVNKIAISGSTLTVYEDDDTTSLGTQAVTSDSGADPITALDTA